MIAVCAMIGSEQRKPDGLTLMPFEPDKIAAFLARTPLGDTRLPQGALALEVAWTQTFRTSFHRNADCGGG